MKKIFIRATNENIGKIEPNVFGSFVEHLGRSIYDGIYNDKSAYKNERGFRTDVLKAIKELGVSIIRYPGGNFVSQYEWKKGIGPKEKRPICLNLAWKEIEPNYVGIDEFIPEMQENGHDIMMAFNLGTADVFDNIDLITYCNSTLDVEYSILRKQNGHNDPYNIKYRCLGNEMDGEWQICQKSAEDYSKRAIEIAKIAKIVDSECKLIACGSSSPYSLTFPEWDKTVLNKTFDYIDYLSIHCYLSYSDLNNKNIEQFLGSACILDSYIQTAKKIINDEKISRASTKEIYLSLDEWNVWHNYSDNQKPEREWGYMNHIVENIYDYADTLVFASMLITILNNVDYIKIACLAQLINVIAPIMTNNDDLLLQGTYYPFAIFANSIKGYYSLKCEDNIPHFKYNESNESPYLYKNIAYSKEKNEYVISLVNVSDKDLNINITLNENGDIYKKIFLQDIVLDAKNTFEKKDAIKPVILECLEKFEGSFDNNLKPYSLCILYIKGKEK